MPALGGFVVMFFPLFLLGAVFGKLMEDSGAAQVIARGMVAQLGGAARHFSDVLACAVLTYGGVSLFVVAFAVYPSPRRCFARPACPNGSSPPPLRWVHSPSP